MSEAFNRGTAANVRRCACAERLPAQAACLVGVFALVVYEGSLMVD